LLRARTNNEEAVVRGYARSAPGVAGTLLQKSVSSGAEGRSRSQPGFLYRHAAHATDSDHVVGRSRRSCAAIDRCAPRASSGRCGASGTRNHHAGWRSDHPSLDSVPARVGLTSEFSVALMLVLLGGRNVLGLPAGGEAYSLRGMRTRTPMPGHTTQLTRPSDMVGQGASAIAACRRSFTGSRARAAIACSFIRTVAHAAWALSTCLFGIGTVPGMMLITSALAAPIS